MMPTSRRTFLTACAAASVARMPLTASLLGSEPDSARDKTRFRFAFCNETFGDWPHEKVCDFVAECGYEGLEIAPFTFADDVREITAARRGEIRRQAEKAGIEVVGLHWLLSRTRGLHLTSPEAETRQRTGEYLEELARFCADVGGSVLVFGSPQQRDLSAGVTAEQGLQFAAEVFTRLAPLLESLRLKLAIEPLSPRTTNFLQTAAEAAELVERINAPAVQLILDCLAMASEATPIPQLIGRHAKQLVHFHANDPNRQGPGFGKLDFVPIFRALAENDYRGWVSVEVFDYSPGAERLARESIRYMRQCVEQA